MLIHLTPGRFVNANQYTTLVCDALDQAGGKTENLTPKSVFARPDIVHVHWPEFALADPWHRAVLRTGRLFTRVWMLKLMGAKLFWTAHNVRPHERKHPALERLVYKIWCKMVDGVFFLSKSSERLVVEAYPQLENKPRFITPHGDYAPLMFKQKTREEVRRELGIPEDALVIGNMGSMRPYKNLVALCEAFREMADDNTWLFISGQCPDPSLREAITKAADGHPRIRLNFNEMSNEEIENYTRTCSVMVFPYTDILNSGSLLFALTVGARSMAPAIGSLPELQSDVGEDWVHLYEGDFGPEILRKALAWSATPTREPAPNLENYDWGRIGHLMMDAYRQVSRKS